MLTSTKVQAFIGNIKCQQEVQGETLVERSPKQNLLFFKKKELCRCVIKYAISIWHDEECCDSLVHANIAYV